MVGNVLGRPGKDILWREGPSEDYRCETAGPACALESGSELAQYRQEHTFCAVLRQDGLKAIGRHQQIQSFQRLELVFPKISEASKWREDWIIQGAPTPPAPIRQEATAVSRVRGSKGWSQIMSPGGREKGVCLRHITGTELTVLGY